MEAIQIGTQSQRRMNNPPPPPAAVALPVALFLVFPQSPPPHIPNSLSPLHSTAAAPRGSAPVPLLFVLFKSLLRQLITSSIPLLRGGEDPAAYLRFGFSSAAWAIYHTVGKCGGICCCLFWCGETIREGKGSAKKFGSRFAGFRPPPWTPWTPPAVTETGRRRRRGRPRLRRRQPSRPRPRPRPPGAAGPLAPGRRRRSA
jgi:hypothetical protein